MYGSRIRAIAGTGLKLAGLRRQRERRAREEEGINGVRESGRESRRRHKGKKGSYGSESPHSRFSVSRTPLITPRNVGTKKRSISNAISSRIEMERPTGISPPNISSEISIWSAPP